MPVLEPEISFPKARKRGPKPLRVRAQFAATAWLDGEILWREGRVVWRFKDRLIEVAGSDLESVSRALSSLRRNEKAARRSGADFEAWHARRVQQLERARHLAAIRAPDLELLTSVSRRRNPAAIERLAELLGVEATVAIALPFSPARALFEAYPHSQRALQALLDAPSQSLQARALAALAIGAARPRDAFPGEPFLRRAARYGARFGFPAAPELCVALLEHGVSDVENSAHCVQNALENRGPLGFDRAQLLALQRAKRDAAAVAALAQAASAMPDPFPSLEFAPVAPKRLDLGAQRGLCCSWNALRVASHAAWREPLAQIAARGDGSDLLTASALLDHLISAPVRALGALTVKRNAMPRNARESTPFSQTIETAAAVALEVLQGVAASPDPGATLQLLHEAAQKSRVCPVNAEMAPPLWAMRWRSYALQQQQGVFAPLLKVARKFGAATAREALRLDCGFTLARQTHLEPEVADFALKIVNWAPNSAADIIFKFGEWKRDSNGAAGIKAAISPLMNALSEATPEERALWLSALLDGVAVSRREAQDELSALARFVPAMRRAARQGAARQGAARQGAADDNAAAGAEDSGAAEAGAVVASSRQIPLWLLVETALALRRGAPKKDKNGGLERFEWLADEMARRWSAAGDESPSWSNLGELVGLMSQLAGEDEAKFRQLMACGWRYTGWGGDFEWPDVERGARIARRFFWLETTLADNFARCPARCFALLEKLGPLDRFESSRAPLEAWRELKEVVPGETWQFGLDAGLQAGLQAWAVRFVRAKNELSESANPPAKLLKIAAWPQKIAAEVAALRSQSDLAPHAAKRLQNLTARLENGSELRASMAREMAEALRNATIEAELRAAERGVESCYRLRLASLGAPQNGVLDADLLNAALFSTDLESNRKWLREIVRRHGESGPECGDWRLEIAGNARWLEGARARGLNQAAWLDNAPRPSIVGGARFELRLENGPLQILQMGNYFGTCLSRGGCNAPSSVANAVELNKRVVFARDAKNRVVGRQLLALSGEGKLLGFRVYLSVEPEQAASLRGAFAAYARDFAARSGVELGDEGEVERLFNPDWWDDGAVPWHDLAPPPSQKKAIKESRSCRSRL